MKQSNPYEKAGLANFDDLYTQNYRRVRSFISRLTRNNDITEDLVQETFIAAFQSIEGSRVQNVYGWICAIAKHKVMDYFRKYRPEQQLETTDENIISGVPTPEQEAVNKELTGLVDGFAEGSISACNLEVLNLSMEGYKPREISRILGISVEATTQRLCRARKSIDDYLNGL